MSQFSLEVSEHVGCWVYTIALMVELGAIRKTVRCFSRFLRLIDGKARQAPRRKAAKQNTGREARKARSRKRASNNEIIHKNPNYIFSET